MKKQYTLLLLLVVLAFASFADGLKIHLNYSTFYSPELGPYIETYMLVEGNSAAFVQNQNGKFQSTLQVLVLFKQGDKIVEYNKYEFNSPELNDTLTGVHTMINFMDQQRYAIPDGNYTMEFEVSDKNSDHEPLKTVQPILIDYPKDEIVASDFMFVDSFSEATEPSMLTRSGYNLIPGVFNFFPDTKKDITLYAEIYNTDKNIGSDEPFLVSVFLEEEESGTKLVNLGRNVREKGSPVVVVFEQFDISAMPSGNYNLNVEVRDRDNNVLYTKKRFMQRSNPRYAIPVAGVGTEISILPPTITLDSLREAVRCLSPRANNSELMFIRHQAPTADRQSLERFFSSFWLDRNETNPAYEWNEYNKLVQFANKKFGIAYTGYDSGRGYYFCRYGQPDHVTGNIFSSSVYTYEIWHYYEIEDQRDAKFVFYSHDYASNTFELLHSNLVGEVNNPQWLHHLYRWPSSINVDYEDQDFRDYLDYYGEQILEEYNNPY